MSGVISPVLLRTVCEQDRRHRVRYREHLRFPGSTSYAPYDQVLVIFAAVDSSGNHTADTSRYVSRNGLTNAMAAYSLDLSTLAVTVPAGSRLAVLFYYYDYFVGEVNHRIAYDNFSVAITNQVTLRETILDSFPPTWPGGVSGIAAQDAGTDGVLRVSWNTATDPGLATTPPVVYDIYRVQSAACTGLWTPPTCIGPTWARRPFRTRVSPTVSTYCYGVRAKDSANPVNATAGVQTATATLFPAAPPSAATAATPRRRPRRATRKKPRRAREQ